MFIHEDIFHTNGIVSRNYLILPHLLLAPPNNPTQFTTTTMRMQSNTGPKAQPPIAKPAPPPTAKQPQPLCMPNCYMMISFFHYYYVCF